MTAVIELEQMTLRKSKRAASGITPRRQATPSSALLGRLDFVVVVVIDVIDVVVVVVIVFVDVADDGRSHAHCRRKCHVDPPAIRPKLFFLREDNALEGEEWRVCELPVSARAIVRASVRSFARA